MTTNIMIYLALIGVAGLLRLRVRFDRIVSWLMLLYIGVLFIDYTFGTAGSVEAGFSFLWNSSRIGDITIDFKSSMTENQLIIPLFFMSFITCLNNNIFRYEEKRSSFNALIILNFVMLSMLISAENYVQLITAVFVSDILGYLILKDVDSSHRYVIYNLFADMCLFMVLALVRSKIQSLELNAFYTYEQIGRHKDFVSIVTLVALFIKTGSFLFQTYLLDLSAVRFQRMSAVNLLFSPLSGLLIMVKMHNLLTVSGLFSPVYAIICVLTVLSGAIGAVVSSHIQKKTVFLNMGAIGLLAFMLQQTEFEWNNLFSAYYIIVFFLNILLFKIYLYQNRQTNVAEMLNSKEINSVALKTILLTIVLLVNLWVTVVYDIALLLLKPSLFIGIGLLVAALGIVLNHIYRSPHTRRLDYLNANALRGLSFVVNLVIIIAASIYYTAYQFENIMFMVCYLLFIAFRPFSTLRQLYEIKRLQTAAPGRGAFKYTLAAPLMYISRTLWLSVDFVLSEKLLTAFFSALNRLSVALFFKINQKSFVVYFIYLLIGTAVFILSFYERLPL